MTFARVLWQASRVKLFIFLTALAWVALGSFYGIRTQVTHPAESPQSLQETAADVMAGTHHCWRHQAPADMAGQIPGHVVVIRDHQAVYGGPALVGQALGQVFDGHDYGLTVIAFCR